MNAKLVVDALRKRHGASGREWAFFDELRAGTGYKNIRKGMNPEQRFDAWAINLYPSKGHMTIAYEVKVSRSDFLHEIANPTKREQALQHSNEFYFAVPAGLVRPDEIPEECGLLYVNEDLTTKVIKKAPYRDEVLLTWGLLASIARRAVKQDMKAV
ncbi:MAG: hypothetical protein ACE3L7_07310 [Candidatus Pristimantibacillus sp.]